MLNLIIKHNYIIKSVMAITIRDKRYDTSISHTIDKILAHRLEAKTIMYNVKWLDNTYSWESEQYVSPDSIEEYYQSLKFVSSPSFSSSSSLSSREQSLSPNKRKIDASDDKAIKTSGTADLYGKNDKENKDNYQMYSLTSNKVARTVSLISPSNKSIRPTFTIHSIATIPLSIYELPSSSSGHLYLDTELDDENEYELRLTELLKLKPSDKLLNLSIQAQKIAKGRLVVTICEIIRLTEWLNRRSKVEPQKDILSIWFQRTQMMDKLYKSSNSELSTQLVNSSWFLGILRDWFIQLLEMPSAQLIKIPSLSIPDDALASLLNVFGFLCLPLPVNVDSNHDSHLIFNEINQLMSKLKKRWNHWANDIAIGM